MVSVIASDIYCRYKLRTCIACGNDLEVDYIFPYLREHPGTVTSLSFDVTVKLILNVSIHRSSAV